MVIYLHYGDTMNFNDACKNPLFQNQARVWWERNMRPFHLHALGARGALHTCWEFHDALPHIYVAHVEDDERGRPLDFYILELTDKGNRCPLDLLVDDRDISIPRNATFDALGYTWAAWWKKADAKQVLEEIEELLRQTSRPINGFPWSLLVSYWPTDDVGVSALLACGYLVADYDSGIDTFTFAGIDATAGDFDRLYIYELFARCKGQFFDGVQWVKVEV